MAKVSFRSKNESSFNVEKQEAKNQCSIGVPPGSSRSNTKARHQGQGAVLTHIFLILAMLGFTLGSIFYGYLS